MVAVAFNPIGVMPACLMPLRADNSVDEKSYRSHLRDLASIRGLTGIVINGHAAEVHALTPEQQIWAIEVACEEVGDKIPLIAGVYAEGTNLAKHLAKSAVSAGVSAILLFPPNSLMFGGNGRAELGSRFVHDIAEVSSLPIVLFQYPISTSLSYSLETLVRLCEDVSNIAALKDLGSDPRFHERTIQTLHQLSRPVNVLTTQSQWLGASLTMGARGIISGAGSVIADRQRKLYDVFTAKELDKSLREKLMLEMSLLAEIFYDVPYVNWQARMKKILYHFGRIETSNVFPPLLEITESDWQRILRLLQKVGLTRETLYIK